ncbi:MAG TPA: DUF4333 domain-containing protein [Nocardia sp.]|uniref:DUF4333 domain-containing protein n=1 Tax=Nocardia TaxID=1817 RepID=UPI00245526A6|nr:MULTISPECIES: DUF4333 domain-containing protein [Nocardia]HLS79271.1 DUF4333 domain-containing protein [Nocardia sp.]
MKIRLAGIVALAGLALAGCSVSIGSTTPTVKEADLERSVAQTLESQLGQPSDEIDCPDDLKGEVGAVLDCTLTVDGQTSGLTVTVTSVEGDTVNYDVELETA